MIVLGRNNLFYLFLSIQVLHQKTQKSLDEITNELCPVLLTQINIYIFKKKKGGLYCDCSIKYQEVYTYLTLFYWQIRY